MPTRKLIRRKGLRKKKTRRFKKTRKNKKTSKRNKKMRGGGEGRDKVLQLLKELELKEDTNIDENYKNKLFGLMEAIDDLKTKESDIRNRNKNRIKHIYMLFLKYIGSFNGETPRPIQNISIDEANKCLITMFMIVSNFNTEEIPQDFENKETKTLTLEEYNDSLNEIFNENISWDKWNTRDIKDWNKARFKLVIKKEEDPPL